MPPDASPELPPWSGAIAAAVAASSVAETLAVGVIAAAVDASSLPAMSAASAAGVSTTITLVAAWIASSPLSIRA